MSRMDSRETSLQKLPEPSGLVVLRMSTYAGIAVGDDNLPDIGGEVIMLSSS